jgi:predicted DNA-binding protein
MTSKNPRINVTFKEETAGILANLAKQENKSIASIVRDLALEALERKEDLYLSELASKIEADNLNKETFTHNQAWK